MINWYPGHMKKSFDELDNKLKLVDIVYLILDSRAPLSSMNDKILDKIKNKKVLVLFNKFDLADKVELTKFEQYYQNKGFNTMLISATSGYGIDRILSKTKKILAEKTQKELNKGLLKTTYKAIILGIPNVGKSTLINKLTKSKLKVENRPGVTKDFTQTKLDDNLLLIDSPGLMMPKMDKHTGLVLASIGSIKDEILNIEDICYFVVGYLNKYYQNRLINRYEISINEDDSIEDIINKIALAKNIIKAKNTIDLDRTYNFILKDLRDLKLGRIIMERINE